MVENNMNNGPEVEEGSSVIEVVMRGSSSGSGSGSNEHEEPGEIGSGQTSQNGTDITMKLKVSICSGFDLQFIYCKIGKISGNVIYNIMSNTSDSDYAARYNVNNNIGSFDNYTGIVTLQGYSHDDIVTTIENNSNYVIIFYGGYVGGSTMYCEQCFAVSGLQLKGTDAITSSNIRNSSEYSNYTWRKTGGGQR